MSNLFSFIKDVIEEFSVAYKYAELDFYKLKTDVISLINNAKNKGYGNPDFCSMQIKVVSKIETSVIIEAYYKKVNGKYQKFTKTLDIGKLTNVPQLVSERLASNGEVNVKLTDFINLYSVKEDDITPTVEFKNLYGFSLKNAKGIPVRKELHIKDELFYYKAVLVYIYENGEKEMRIKHFGNILDMPEEVAAKIASNEDKACFIVCK